MKFIFDEGAEIRMGSPHWACDMRIEPETPELKFLENYAYDKIQAQSKDGKVIGLIRWSQDLSQGPAFHIVLVNTDTKDAVLSPRIKGGAISIEVLERNKARYQKVGKTLNDGAWVDVTDFRYITAEFPNYEVAPATES